MAIDFLGNELSVGDNVVFVNYNGTSADLERETITKIFPHQASVRRKRRAEYKIVKLPTVLSEPVRHGHWEFKDDFGNRNYDFVAVCSRCGNEKKASGYSHSEWISEWRYCNACGAKMDEVI